MTTPAAQPSSTYGRETSLRRRVVSFVLAVLINLLILLVLLNMTPHFQGMKGGQGKLTTFNLNNDNNQSNESKKAAKPSKPASSSAHAAKEVTQPVVPPPLPIPAKEHTFTPFIELTQDDFKKTDISKIPGHAEKGEAQASAGSGAGGGSGEGDSELAGGSGPNGEPLYRAEWYREPTDAELVTYLPRTITRGSWGEIACQTLPRFHVDNCIALADSPPGSHLANALQQAGWQFLVRPPRVGGKALIGAWVRIRIDFSKEAKLRDMTR